MSVDDKVATAVLVPVATSMTLFALRVIAVGAVVSTVMAKPADATLVLPAVSVTLVVRVCAPSLRVLDVMLQLPEPSAVAVPSTVVPSVS